ncbi:hypothetical protein TNCV_1204611 [Trichonephila clavipes]|nr:hypothetical protein TNCV_1204611 [Trichonephila clavipes]
MYTGIAIPSSDADRCADGPRFESRRRHRCLQMCSAFAARGYFKQQSSSKCSREVGGRKIRMGGPQDVFPLNWGETEPNNTVTCIGALSCG